MTDGVAEALRQLRGRANTGGGDSNQSPSPPKSSNSTSVRTCAGAGADEEDDVCAVGGCDAVLGCASCAFTTDCPSRCGSRARNRARTICGESTGMTNEELLYTPELLKFIKKDRLRKQLALSSLRGAARMRCCHFVLRLNYSTMRFVLRFLLCTAYLFASLVCADSEAPALLVLTPENFDDIIAEHSNVLVEVCVPVVMGIGDEEWA